MEERRRAWMVAVTLWLAFLFLTAYEIAPASFLPLVREGLDVGPAAASWLVSALLLAMAVFSIPAGIVLDRVDNRRAIFLSITVLLLSTIWAWRAGRDGGYAWVLTARFVGGGAIVTLWTAAVNVVDGSFDRDIQGTAIAFLATSIPGGFAIGHLTAPLLADRVGWAGSFPVYGVLAFLGVVAFAVTSRGGALTVDAEAPSRREFGTVLRNRYVWTVAGMAFVAFSLNLLFNNWLPTYVAENFSLPLGLGGAIAAFFPAVGVVARASGGVLSDRFFGTRRRPIVLGSFVVLVPASVAIPFIDHVAFLLVALVVTGFVTQIGLVLLLPYVRELVADNVAATAFAVLNTVGFLGAFSAPVVSGALIEEAGFLAAFGYAGLLAGVGCVLAWSVPDSTQFQRG
ncbi:MAG: MFS transporter [Haloarculaceae archaeon]